MEKGEDFGERIEREIKELQQQNKEWGRQFGIVMGFQRGGMDAEKRGETEDAMRYYKSAIYHGQRLSMIGLPNYFYSFERLIILFRKAGLYAFEVLYIENLLTELMGSNLASRDKLIFKYEKRLNKAKELADKNM